MATGTGGDLSKKVKNLHEAIDKNDVGTVRKLLNAEASAESVQHLCIAELQPFGTALHHAAGVGDNDTANLVLKSGVDVNIRQTQSPVTQNQTPLHIAALAGHANTVKFLLSVGADPNVQESEGLTSLHCACSGSSLDTVSALVEGGAQVNMEDHRKETPLQRSILRSTSDICKYLIEHGANIHVKDSDGQTLLHYAVEWENMELVKLFLNMGISVNSQDSEGCSPLHLAENEQILTLLIEHGGDTKLRNKRGKAPITQQLDVNEYKSLDEALGKHLNLQETPESAVSLERAREVVDKFNQLVFPTVPGDGSASSKPRTGLLAELLAKTKTKGTDNLNK